MPLRSQESSEGTPRTTTQAVTEVLRKPLQGPSRPGRDAYERYLLSCSDYLKRQMMIYEHWPQRRYDSLGYKDEKVFTDMNT